MVERTNDMSLGKYMQKYIWEPLGIKNITFHLEERPDMLERFPEMTERLGGMHPMFGTAADPSGKLGWGTNIWWRQGMTDDSGGAGGYCSAVDYQKILHSITAGDGKLLGPEMLEELFRPQLSDSARAQFALGRTIKQINDIQTSGVPIATQMDHALGGAILLEDLEGRRRKGTLSWGGLPNMYWWADRASGISGMYGSNLIPTADPRSIEMFKVFEADVYEKAKSQGVKL
jgi:CubicO group peptidase (beta-lactamase class C family)